MPELPEVETIRRSLLENTGAHVRKIEMIRTDIIRKADYSPEELVGQAIMEIKRRGKYLIMVMEKDQSLVVHLGMSGRFYMEDEEASILVPHVHMIIHLDNKHKILYRDARRFGGVWFSLDPETLLKHMGQEPLEKGFTSSYLSDICRNRKVAIKTLLLNQNLISGIGNIYADESLFAAKIRPDREAGSISEKEIKRLHQAIIKVLQSSIEKCGTTFRDFRDGNNQSGQYQSYLNVYGKTDTPCKTCGLIIKKDRIGGRSSHYCEKCQK